MGYTNYVQSRIQLGSATVSVNADGSIALTPASGKTVEVVAPDTGQVVGFSGKSGTYPGVYRKDSLIGFFVSDTGRCFVGYNNGGIGRIRVGIIDIGYGTGITSNPDFYMYSEWTGTYSALVLDKGNSPVALHLYGTRTDSSNWERGALRWNPSTQIFELVTEAAGTGTLRGLRIGTATGTLGFFGATPVSKPAALTAADGSVVDATYGTEEANVINNLRTRLNELESRLQGLGLLS